MGITSDLDTTKERMSELKHKSIEIIQMGLDGEGKQGSLGHDEYDDSRATEMKDWGKGDSCHLRILVLNPPKF